MLGGAGRVGRIRRPAGAGCRDRHPGSRGCRRTCAVLNSWVLAAFAPLLVVVAVLGHRQGDAGRTSGAPAYNAFHLAFGAAGLAVLALGTDTHARVFNVGFGLVDLYQALASRMGWFPAASFRWKRADDVAHVVVGVALVLVGALG